MKDGPMETASLHLRQAQITSFQKPACSVFEQLMPCPALIEDHVRTVPRRVTNNVQTQTMSGKGGREGGRWRCEREVRLYKCLVWMWLRACGLASKDCIFGPKYGILFNKTIQFKDFSSEEQGSLSQLTFSQSLSAVSLPGPLGAMASATLKMKQKDTHQNVSKHALVSAVHKYY